MAVSSAPCDAVPFRRVIFIVGLLLAAVALLSVLDSMDRRLVHLEHAITGSKRSRALRFPPVSSEEPDTLQHLDDTNSVTAIDTTAAAKQSSPSQQFLAAAAANISEYRSTILGRLQTRYNITPTARKADQGFKEGDWSYFQPIISCPPERPLTRYGSDGDGGKILCRIEGHLQDSCVIYSLGSNGDYSFEQDMLNRTGCEIHTFDCTFDGKSIHDRHAYHHWCIGAGGDKYRTWQNITETLGHGQVDLLKMDIESYEYPVLADFKPNMALPQEISMEVHAQVNKNDGRFRFPQDPVHMSFVFLHLANLGYGTYSYELNAPYGPECCTEVSLMRIWPEANGFTNAK